MTQCSNNDRLPFEILTMIFDNFKYYKRNDKTWEGRYLWKKRELVNFLSVCRSWSFAVRKLLGPSISVYLKEVQLIKFSKDVRYFSHEIKAIILQGGPRKPAKAQDKYRNIFWKILIQCPNLVSLEFYGYDIRKYFTMLIQRKTQLKRLEYIRGEVKKHTDMGLLYLRVVHRYRETIKTVCLKDLDEILGNNFYDFIAGFPNLTVLRIHGYKFKKELNVSRILESVPKLKIFQLSGVDFISSNFEGKNANKPVVESLHLKSVSINATDSSADDLLYIMTQIDRVNISYVKVCRVNGKMNSEEESTKFMNDLKTYLNRKIFDIEYRYGGKFCCSYGNFADCRMVEIPRDTLIQEEAHEVFYQRLITSINGSYTPNRRFHFNEGNWDEPYSEGYMEDDEDHL